MSNLFSDLNSLEYFSISSTAGNTGRLFANGLQQVTLYVSITAVDSEYNYVYLDEEEYSKLVANVSVIDYYTKNSLIRTDGDALNATGWAYTLNAGRFDQLSASSRNSNGIRDDKRMTLIFYIMCPEEVTLKNITLAAKITLDNGVSIDTTGSPFNSSVMVSALAPVIYEVSDINSSYKGLLTERTTVFDYEENYGDKYRSYCYNYHVSIASQSNPNGYMKEKVFYPVGNKTDKNSRPDVKSNFTRKPVINDRLSFAASIYGQGRAVCYIYEDSDPGVNTLGMGGYTEDVPSQINPRAFNFTSIHFYSWSADSAAGQKYLGEMRCEFRDQYGNPGAFYAKPYAGIGDEFHRASFIEFHN